MLDKSAEDLQIGSIVTIKDPYHRRGASAGVIESISRQCWYQIWWEEDADNQIHPAARTFEDHELKLWNHEKYHKSTDRS